MASDAHVILVDPAAGSEEHARRRLRELERRWSRFVPRSDISRLNAAPEAMLVVSSDTIALLDAMKEGWRVTRGRYDPTMLAAIIAAGYRRSIDGSGAVSRRRHLPSRGHTIADVTTDEATSSALAPAGVGLDPGGIGKGLAADMVVTELLAGGTAGALVGVGGDLAASGSPPTPAGWRVAVEHPLGSSPELATLAFGGGGIATSSVLSRTWVRRGRPRHHVMDPATGSCATTDLAAVTVVARAGWEAEVHATAALMAGSERALTYLENHQVDGMATTLEGQTTMTAKLRDAAEPKGVRHD